MRQNRPIGRGAIVYFGVITLIGATMSVLANLALKDWLIINYGIRCQVLCRRLGLILTITGICGTIICLMINGIAQYRQQKATKIDENLIKHEQKIVTEYAENSDNPEYTRRRLMQLEQKLPDFKALIERCLTQMDQMDLLQARQDTLIRENEALYLEQTVKVLNNVERRLCQNFRAVINLLITATNSSDFDYDKTEKYLQDNEQKLKDAKYLLAVSVDWVNKYNDNADDYSAEIENWIAVIQKSLQEG